ncbi:hypothetical protein F5878DRAFT_667891 [Lentinula raphanica]|uniref:Uncharacterized protein n=1 Tax=Lentinula raphanica TaxID=153919 RepID=A0AA38NUZ4_9AGAR|nr:hypothetical protein F5878DRAFT_667891 [Lentinula raphanica]
MASYIYSRYISSQTLSSPPKPTSVNTEGTSRSSTINPDRTQSRAHETHSLVELLDQFGDFVMVKIPLSQALFKVGASIYLLFLARVFQKFWVMFQSQALAIGLGNLGLSVVLLLLIRLGAFGPVRLQVDERYRVPEIIVDTLIFVGASTCISIIWQITLIVGDFPRLYTN